MKIPAPIILFVYNRPWHTKQTLESLVKNHGANESVLWVYADGAKNHEDDSTVSQVREIITNVEGFRETHLVARDRNYGLAGSISEGVTDIIAQYGKAIILEDDLVTMPYFLSYMNDALDLYENDHEVASIHGYMYPASVSLPVTFFIRGADCWGWATWKRAWKCYNPDAEELLDQIRSRGLTRQFNFNNSIGYTRMLKKVIQGKADSWAIRWYASAFLAGMMTLYPYPSLVKNIGHDNSGTHSGNIDIWNDRLRLDRVPLKKIPVRECPDGRMAFEAFFRKLKSPGMLMKRAANKLTSGYRRKL